MMLTTNNRVARSMIFSTPGNVFLLRIMIRKHGFQNGCMDFYRFNIHDDNYLNREFGYRCRIYS